MRILEEGRIGNLRLRNRTKFASATTCFCTEEGRVTEREIKWLEERARGGIGLVTTGIAHVTPWGRLNPNMLGGWDDSFIEDFRRLADAIHVGGAKACLSMGHCGRYTHSKTEVRDASSVATRIMTRTEPAALGAEEIAGLVRAFGDTARRAKTAGFDAVEVCACAGYLLASFLSPWTNRRTDQYGGSLENRARFCLEVIDAIRTEVGQDMPILVRMCADELMPEGNGPEDLKRVATMFEQAGVAALSFTVGWHESMVPAITGEVPRGHWLYLAEGMKKTVKIPIMMAYRVMETEAEEAMKNGIIDFWEAARSFIADPEIPNKLAANRPQEIVPCICCCQGCYDNVFKGKPIHCIVNPRAGRESDPAYGMAPAVQKKKVAIIGGGPAGMEAAVIAARRGHTATLYEQKGELGGNLLAASAPPYKMDFGDLSRYYATKLKSEGVTVRLGKEVLPDSPEFKGTDVVILATGASPLIPAIPGVDGKNVVTAVDVLSGKKKPGANVVIVGGGLVGTETAEYLSKKGSQVTVLEMLDKIAGDMGATIRWRHLIRLKEGGVKVVTGATVTGIGEKGVEVTRKGEKEFYPAEQVILAAGMKSNAKLAATLKANVPALFLVGDALEPRKLGEAIQEGYCAAVKI